MVSIDTVYQRVLAIANKEQRGYITPQEFNLFANQAQMEIFEQYFYDLNQFSKTPGNSTEYSDMVDLLEEKINIFKRTKEIPSLVSDTIEYPENTYRIGNLYKVGHGIITKVNLDQLILMNNSLILKPNTDRPVYIDKNKTLTLYYGDEPLGPITLTFVKKPDTVNWSYIVVGEQALYDNGLNSKDFQLHESEETSLVMKILSYAGITLKDATLYQVSEATEAKKIQQEKQ